MLFRSEGAQVSGWVGRKAFGARDDFLSRGCSGLNVFAEIASQRDFSRYQAARRLNDSARFQEFVRKHMRPAYFAFRYATGKQDLPEQMYAIFRSGLILLSRKITNPTGNFRLERRECDSL